MTNLLKSVKWMTSSQKDEILYMDEFIMSIKRINSIVSPQKGQTKVHKVDGFIGPQSG